MKARYREFCYNGGVQNGLMDVAILPAAEALKADYVWAMEYDVDFTGSWARFFEQFRENRADLLSSVVMPYEQSRAWYHWSTARPPRGVPRSTFHRAFHPVMRLSRPFLRWYIDEMNRRRWRGHYEYTLPTSALCGGFRVEDLGSDGPLCPPARRGKNYTRSAGDTLEGEGSLAWRPSRKAYWTEAPESFERAETLYHPVKPEALDWERARRRPLAQNLRRRVQRLLYRL